MKTAVFVGLLAIIGYATAHCGCLKCSKHLTVIGKTIPGPGCGPATVIYRGSPNPFEDHILPIKIQTPGHILPLPTEIDDLKYKIVHNAPCKKVLTEIIEPGYKYDTKIEIPGPIHTLPAPILSLKPSVDRIILPGPHRGWDRDDFLINPCGGGEVIVKPSPPFNPHHPICSPPVCVKPCRDPPIFIDPIRPPIYVNPLRPPCGPFCGPPETTIVKKCISRYRYFPFPRSLLGVDSVSEAESKIRSKRDIPFLRHGYKFMVNMLPDFLQEPIKHTVNDLALTHPDGRMLNQPPKLTLRDKLQWQRKKNIALLKNKLKNHTLKKNIDNTPQGLNHFSSRSSFVDQTKHLYYERLKTEDEHDNSRPSGRFNEEVPSDLLRNVNAVLRNSKIAGLKRSLLMKKLRHLDNRAKRAKRGTAHQKYWEQKYRKYSGSKKHPNLFGSSEIVLPFYQVKEESSENNPYEAYLGKPVVEAERYRYRRQDNFLEPYNFKDVTVENHKTKEHLMRNVIRQELGKFHTHNQVQPEQQYSEPLLTEHHSPILHIITFPLRILHKFGEITKQMFPTFESLPNVVKGTKRYFKDFGKNFKKNFLHLTSDLIGDFENMEITNRIFGPIRTRRSTTHTKKNKHEEKSRKKRYILKKVDEDELEEYLMDKLSIIFDSSETTTSTESYPNLNYQYNWPNHNEEDESDKKLILEHLKPKIILDNNGKPFLEVNGYKRPLWKPTKKIKPKKLKLKNPLRKLRRYDSSEETDSDKIASLIHHAKNHVGNGLNQKYSDMPAKTIKEKISQLLFETDIMVHLDFERYHDIYDDLLALQHIKTSITEDWKRLIMSKAIDDIGAKITLLERFKELQYYKDLTMTNVVTTLSQECDNVFMVKKLVKMLVRLNKLQCLINQVVTNFEDHLHISTKSEIEKEIKYVDFLSSLNFALDKSRNDMITNLIKDRDIALQRNIFLLDKLKKLLMFETHSDKVEQEANLLWEMKNIEKMQKTTIEELKHKSDYGYKLKNELKILFDLLRRYEACEADQKKLLSKFEEQSSEEEEESSEEVVSSKNPLLGKKLDLEEIKEKWQERLKKQKMLLKKKLRKSKRKFGKKSEEDD